MTTFKVQLAEVPTAVMNALFDVPGGLHWPEIRERCGATSSDMNLLVDLGFIRRGSVTERWALTAQGRGAMVPVNALSRKEGGT